MTLEIERRYLPTEIEVRAKGDGKSVIEGYAYKFDARSQNLGGFRETILVGAGAESAGKDDVRALINHEASLILGRSASGTLRIAEDSTGLHYEIDADERQTYVRDLMISLERGDVTQSSFGFTALEDDWSLDETDTPLRSVRKLALFDVSPVTYPAYLASESKVSQRALRAAESLTRAEAIVIPTVYALPIDPRLALQALRG